MGVVTQGDLRIAPYLRLAIGFLVYLRLAGFRGVGPLAWLNDSLSFKTSLDDLLRNNDFWTVFSVISVDSSLPLKVYLWGHLWFISFKLYLWFFLVTLLPELIAWGVWPSSMHLVFWLFGNFYLRVMFGRCKSLLTLFTFGASRSHLRWICCYRRWSCRLKTLRLGIHIEVINDVGDVGHAARRLIFLSINFNLLLSRYLEIFPGDWGSLQLFLTFFVLLLLNPRVYQWLLLFFLVVNAIRQPVSLSCGFRVVLLKLLVHLGLKFLHGCRILPFQIIR